MPITYTYDAVRNILHSYHSGLQTVAGICAHFRQIAQDPAIRAGYIEVVHCSDDTEFDFTSNSAQLIPIRFEELKDKKNIRAAILIGATQLQYGIARMMKNLHALYDPSDDFRVVRSEEEAEQEIHSILKDSAGEFPDHG